MKIKKDVKLALISKDEFYLSLMKNDTKNKKLIERIKYIVYEIYKTYGCECELKEIPLPFYLSQEDFDISRQEFPIIPDFRSINLLCFNNIHAYNGIVHLLLDLDKKCIYDEEHFQKYLQKNFSNKPYYELYLGYKELFNVENSYGCDEKFNPKNIIYFKLIKSKNGLYIYLIEKTDYCNRIWILENKKLISPCKRSCLYYISVNDQTISEKVCQLTNTKKDVFNIMRKQIKK